MSSDVYKRIKRRQRERIRRQRRRRRIAVLMLLIMAVIVIVVCSFRGKDTSKSASDKNTTEGAEVALKNTVEIVQEKSTDESPETDQSIHVPYPVKSKNYKRVDSDKVLSPYIALLDVNNGEIIAGRDISTRIYPASMTKVMTLIVAVENLEDLNKKYTFTAELIDPLYRQEASLAGFAPGEEVTALDMLYGLILPSGADAAVGLANLISGTEEDFVKLMNEKCKVMGLKKTHFTNTSGLYSEEHYTTPVEMAMIMQYAMSNETCAKVLSAYQYTTASTKQHPEGIPLTSTMFSRMYGTEVETVTIIGGKTGYTAEAGSCMVSCAARGDDKYIVVTAKAAGKWKIIFDAFELYGNYIPNPPGYTKS